MDSALYFWKESNVKRACEAKLTPISVDFDAKNGRLSRFKRFFHLYLFA